MEQCFLSLFKDFFPGKWDKIIFCDNLSFIILPMVSEVWLPTTRRSIGWLLPDLCKEVEGDDSVVPFTLASACGWNGRKNQDIAINSSLLYILVIFIYSTNTYNFLSVFQ